MISVRELTERQLLADIALNTATTAQRTRRLDTVVGVLLVLIPLSLLLGHSAAADEPINTLPAEERRSYAEQGLEFAQCAGLFFAVSDIGRETGAHIDDVNMSAGFARGALLVAQGFFALSMPDPRRAGAYAQDQVDGNRTTWRAKIRGGGAPDLPEWLERCTALSSLQAQIIEEMRKGMLTDP